MLVDIQLEFESMVENIRRQGRKLFYRTVFIYTLFLEAQWMSVFGPLFLQTTGLLVLAFSYQNYVS